MKKFRFTLQPVLEHRQRIEDNAKLAMAARQRELDRAQEELDDFNARYREHSDLLRGEHRKLTAEDLRLHYAHVAFLDRAIDAQLGAVAQRRAAVDRARAEVLEASKERKAVEKLKERRREAHDVEDRRMDQNELDDANARRHARSPERTPSP
jgi:flagellar FliJ protein